MIKTNNIFRRKIRMSISGIHKQSITSLFLECSKMGLFYFILLRIGHCVAKVAIDKKRNSSGYVNENISLMLVSTLFFCI